jgi:hypothetical protein
LTFNFLRCLPGLGVFLGARVLGEFGDDPNRYTTAKCRKNYAGTSPLTIASGKNAPCWPATSATAGSTTPSISGPSAHCRQVPAPACTMTNDAPQATYITKHSALSATASSAFSTAAYATEPPTTNTKPGHTVKPLWRLDKLHTWDV